ncbi:phosphopantetheinyl protein transferase [Idiomarina sp. A28L]|uniref:holo-ACP synthase n=1 Tax=Idiomarina sp. A28L TaxID=1036674 RepID=UPI000213876B|nr:holo-ACP synthase [Idiomarina sp. A28L]EGN75685.1 phosphopantetheinyl protein transferase [Idiomarina sp. A28L]
MAIVGIGTDIVEIERIRRALQRQPGLAKRLLTPTEHKEFIAASEPERYLAKRFAAKEAALKALGTGLQNGMSWQHIEIGHTSLGQPLLVFMQVADTLAKELLISHHHLSLSDEAHYAQAMVVLECR